jgi:hypothetical protein
MALPGNLSTFQEGLTRLVFPSDLQDESQGQGHWMNIKCYESGDTSVSSVITLFIPGGGQNSPLVWEQKYDYAEVLMTRAIAGTLGIGGITSAINTGMQMAGRSINPKVEILFRNVQLRTFQFTFLFAPSSEQESLDMQQIIKLLRYHAEPEIIGSNDPNQSYIGIGNQINYLTTGNFLKSPSEFKIDFYNIANGQARINDAIPKIARGVIESIDVNYAPQGQFSTFSNGHPVSAMLTFILKEMRIIGKENIVRNGY